jgi:hypothetical protein
LVCEVKNPFINNISNKEINESRDRSEKMDHNRVQDPDMEVV